MEQIIELKINEEKTVGDISITNTGGGHRILKSPAGGRGGDMSTVAIVCKTPRVEAVKIIISNIKGTKKTFDNYIISLVEMDWNGASVRLSIKKFK